MLKDNAYRILLCDDDPDEALFLESAFIKAGFKVDLEWFNRCSTLLEHLPVRLETPDLIFVDIGMPGESGLECLGEIRRFAAYKHVPVIMYTTSALSRDIEVAYKSGANLYLPKTSSEEELIEIVKYVIMKGREGLQCPKRDDFCYFPKRGGS
jgi:DNA-binding response OmpR family regulator